MHQSLHHLLHKYWKNLFLLKDSSQKVPSRHTTLCSVWQKIISSPKAVFLNNLTKFMLLKSISTWNSKLFTFKTYFLFLFQKNVHSKKIGFKFLISNTEFNCFFTADLSLIESWSLHLSKLINQRGFHELFKPIRKLGKGNFASVYEVERVTDLRRFAVKAFSKQNTFAAKNGKESLINELAVMRVLDHQNILRLESVYESENSIYVVE